MNRNEMELRARIVETTRRLMEIVRDEPGIGTVIAIFRLVGTGANESEIGFAYQIMMNSVTAGRITRIESGIDFKLYPVESHSGRDQGGS